MYIKKCNGEKLNSLGNKEDFRFTKKKLCECLIRSATRIFKYTLHCKNLLNFQQSFT